MDKSKIKKSELWELLTKSKPSMNKPPNINTAIELVCTELSLDISNPPSGLKPKIQNEIRAYTKHNDKQRALPSGQRTVISGEDLFVIDKDELIDSDDETSNSAGEPKSKMRRKSFIDLTLRMQRLRTDDLMKSLNSFLEVENKDSQNPMTITQILGYLIYRANYISDKKTAELGMDIYEQRNLERNSFSNMDAISLMHDLTLTKSQMRTMKSYLAAKGVFFPNTDELLKARAKLRPVIHDELDGDGVSVNYVNVIEMTSSSLINVIKSADVNSIVTNKELKIVYKDGCDGAGSQTVWDSVSMKDASDHMFQYGVVPLRVEQDSKVLWKNPTPNAASSVRPVYLLRAAEDEDRVIDLYVKTTDTARTFLNSYAISIHDRDGLLYNVQHMIHDTMKDLKLKKKLSGCGGADCILCESRTADWKDPVQITNGFPITRFADSTMQLYEQLVAQGEGEILKAANDYATRKGITAEPKTTSSQHSICITHSYINVLGWIMKVLYRCNCSYECWIEKKTCLGDHIRKSKEKVQTMIKDGLGLVIDKVGGLNAKTGM
jgi:hypothetical protein